MIGASDLYQVGQICQVGLIGALSGLSFWLIWRRLRWARDVHRGVGCAGGRARKRESPRNLTFSVLPHRARLLEARVEGWRRLQGTQGQSSTRM